MITLNNLSKQFGHKKAVDDLTVTIRPGMVTGFLGPNGAGKTTTMRMILGLDYPTAGTALVNGVRYRKLPTPLHTIGALLDPRTGHPGQSAHSHLAGLARSNGIPGRRATDVLETTGLAEVAHKRIGSFSLGMGQRLGIASALLGDPGILMFDEPVNGLDPDGVHWIRQLMRSLAAEGRTVFVSSHLLSEMQETADHLVVIGRGRLIADAPTGDILGSSARKAVTVRSPQATKLQDLLQAKGMNIAQPAPGELRVTGAGLEQIGAIAFAAEVQIDELTFEKASLEQAYRELTGESIEYSAVRPSTTDHTADSSKGADQ